MSLQVFWFVLVMVLFAGFFLLEGFDFGVGMLLPFLGRNNAERSAILGTIGPFWDANEVWLITAAGAIFAAFPSWYATLFSGFYLIFVLLLLALILRGAALEFRGKHDGSRWRMTWDWLAFVGSALPGFLWGVAVANILLGVPVDASMHYVGTPWQLFNPYALIAGLAFTLMFALHGAIFLSLKTEDHLMERASKAALLLWLPTLLLILAFITRLYMASPVVQNFSGDLRVLIPIIGALALIIIPVLVLLKRSGMAFIMTSLAIVLTTVAIAMAIFPNVLLSSINPAWNLTIYNSSSSPYSLTVMSWVALTFVPFVLAYQAWNYWVFRKRVSLHALSSH
ncbi:cytochrome d ubiquinol oxidase subunit II [Ktedonospora formicarum]|uniref:Cytochrome c oxidase assembly protein n=1 Tax=Ktedonospora formicarum TaxID=2778364 RepID=A0A8J3I2D2_9CHLR|nr:cytochrome d ubiquinol oxidase subunit II [Ktedonospora formicarum]GHO46336.1 cytochrome c oxidase assembly protein [Ktedonospora formicarum]